MSSLLRPLSPESAALQQKNDVYARALNARDARFDGVFFVGITTTRIYCRPVCPSRLSQDVHRRFFTSAAAAEHAGFRPCLRCRPELAPGRAVCDAISRLAYAAARRIAAGALNGHSVADLARSLGVSERHLRRALDRELGVSPIELAQTHRLLLAKQLLVDTSLPVTRVADASGFQSLRRFNAAFSAQYRMPPSAVRRTPRRASAAAGELRAGTSDSDASDEYLRLTLSYRAPLAWNLLLAFLSADAIGGVEIVDDVRYARTIQVAGRSGIIMAHNVRAAALESNRKAGINSAAMTHISVDVSSSLVPALMPLLARLRHLFDLDAEPTAIDAHLSRAGLTDLVNARPGIRIPGAVDGFETALRALFAGRMRVAGAGARSRKGDGYDNPVSLVARALGTPIATGVPGLDRLMPTAARVAEAGSAQLVALGIPERRANAAVQLATMVASGTVRLEPGSDVTSTYRTLTAIEGLGNQTATMIVMRALYWPDAFPAEDRALLRVSRSSSPSDLLERAEHWRPWRAYAALHLWLADELGTSASVSTTAVAHAPRSRGHRSGPGFHREPPQSVD